MAISFSVKGSRFLLELTIINLLLHLKKKNSTHFCLYLPWQLRSLWIFYIFSEEDVFPLYRLSYHWFTSLGTIIVLVVGNIVSWMTGPVNSSTIDRRLLSPVIHSYVNSMLLSITHTESKHCKFLSVSACYRNRKMRTVLAQNQPPDAPIYKQRRTFYWLIWKRSEWVSRSRRRESNLKFTGVNVFPSFQRSQNFPNGIAT